MNKIIFILALLFFSSCTKTDWSETPNVFIVTKVIQREGQNPNMTTYKVEMPDETKLGSVSFWFADSVGFYKVGDVLKFKQITL